MIPQVPAPPQQAKVPEFVPGQVLVQLESRVETRARLGLSTLKQAMQRNEALKTEVQADVEAPTVSVARTLSLDQPTVGDLVVVPLPADTSPDEAIADLQDHPGVKSVQKNWIYALQQTSNDVEYLTICPRGRR